MRFLLERCWVVVLLVAGLLAGCGDTEPAFVQSSTFLPDFDDTGNYIMFGPDGSSLVSGSFASDNILVWDVDSWEITQRLVGHTSGVADVAFSSDGLVGSASGDDFSARIWDPVTGEALWVWEFPEPDNSNLRVAFNDDGSLFAVSGSDPIRVWDVSSGELITELSSDVFVFDMAFGPDGRLLYAATDDDRVLVWDLEADEIVHELKLPDDSRVILDLSPDGSLLATVPSESEFILWDTETWEQVSTLQVPVIEEGYVPYTLGAPTFSPDGSMIVSTGDGGVLVWDVESGEVILQETAYGSSRNASFSPDSNRIAVSEFVDGFTLWERNDQ